MDRAWGRPGHGAPNLETKKARSMHFCFVHFGKLGPVVGPEAGKAYPHRNHHMKLAFNMLIAQYLQEIRISN